MLIFNVHNFYFLGSTRIDLHASMYQKHILFLILYTYLPSVLNAL